MFEQDREKLLAAKAQTKATPVGLLWRIASTRMPTRWGVFDAIGFERDAPNGGRTETALAMVMGDLTEGAPLLRVHSQCLTGECSGRCAAIAAINLKWPCRPSPRKAVDS